MPNNRRLLRSLVQPGIIFCIVLAVLFSAIPSGKAEQSAQDISTNATRPPLPSGFGTNLPPRFVGQRSIPERNFRLPPVRIPPVYPTKNLPPPHPPVPPEGLALRQIPTRTLQLTPSPPPSAPPGLGQIPTNTPRLGLRPDQQLPTNYINLVELMRGDRQLNSAAAASNSVQRYEKWLADPKLTPSLRKTFETEVEVNQRRLQDARADEVLWDDVRNARAAGDQKKLADAEQKLANHLVKKLEAWDLKTYPANLTLKEVTELYRQRISTGR